MSTLEGLNLHESGSKESWQMTSAEYREYVLSPDMDWKSDEWQELITWDWGRRDVKYGEQIARFHRELVRRAQAEGKVIPEEVLRELDILTSWCYY